MDRFTDARGHRRSRSDRALADRDGGDAAAVPRPDPRRRGRGDHRHPLGRAVRPRRGPRIAVRGVRHVRSRPGRDEPAFVGVDRLHPARVQGGGRVQPHRPLLRHPPDDVHHQARPGSDPDLVGWDGAAQPTPGGRTGLQLHRSVQPGLRRPPRRLRPRPRRPPGGLDADDLRGRHHRQGVGDRGRRARVLRELLRDAQGPRRVDRPHPTRQ